MNNNLDIATTTLSGVLTALQTDEVFKWVGFILTLLSALVGIAYRIWHWYKDAKEDGKITADEIKKLGEIVKSGTDEVIDIVTTKEDNKDNTK